MCLRLSAAVLFYKLVQTQAYLLTPFIFHPKMKNESSIHHQAEETQLFPADSQIKSGALTFNFVQLCVITRHALFPFLRLWRLHEWKVETCRRNCPIPDIHSVFEHVYDKL